MASEQTDGGPAFPLPEKVYEHSEVSGFGMSLRDYFAAKAMQAIIEDVTHTDKNGFPTTEDFSTDGAAENCYITVATDAYAMADAMLAARSAPKGGA